jgi:hypothetical protein
MTPKEKAKELFNKMYFIDDPMGNYPMCFETAKQCALIAVDEIIKEVVLSSMYWQEVKQEIQAL